MEIRCFVINVIFFVASFVYAQDNVVIHSPTQKMKFYPCSDCHQSSPLLSSLSLKPRTLRKREGNHKNMEFKHMPEVMDCLICHGHKNPDELVLLDGQSIRYEQVPLLCGQCHGLKKGKWEKGFHGKIKGSWKDQKVKLICTECHRAHKPKFPQLKAFAPPTRPKFGIEKGGE